MHVIDPQGHTRRAFLRRSGALAMAGSAMPFAMTLAAMGEAAAQSAPGDDYKALVCVFLFGGCDYGNTVITYDDASHAKYTAIRVAQASGGIAIAKDALAATALTPSTALPDGRQYALHPSMTAMKAMFDAGTAAVQLNVGPLVIPLNRALYNNGNKKLYPVPPKLFSHNDQQSTWQSSRPEGSTVGWGGNIGDIVLGGNTNSLFTCISVAGNAVFLSGDHALQYQVGTGGAVKINSMSGTGSVFGSTKVREAMSLLTQKTRAHTLENEYGVVTTRAVNAEGQVNGAIGTPFTFGASGDYPDTGLHRQLGMVARLIRGRTSLGARRQVFFVSLGGFDLHDNLIARQGPLLQQLSQSISDFHTKMLPADVAGKVTTFTASDFGRTLSSNGDGTDHGWGSHHFIAGGAVKGGAIYGAPPPVSVENKSGLEGYDGHVGQGRLIPTTSVDQYGATMGKWFGLNDAQLLEILPNLSNFGAGSIDIGGVSHSYPRDVGFMKPA
ncbi:DUF1501 domain-containing protein [Variovorax dokdonensis]|uniref:DUF1501 domain-containing protein n=1 Tax=Variovorax dokdonensis TaxID=344883 RepID=A0ABT7N9T9_9BURK|nr:DUF1501 domain-containing protein [Variovorax dokdonensis]MDM0044714.1 DUF1501 domain-containing protein [Variovorax dokdonensis]